MKYSCQRWSTGRQDCVTSRGSLPEAVGVYSAYSVTPPAISRNRRALRRALRLAFCMCFLSLRLRCRRARRRCRACRTPLILGVNTENADGIAGESVNELSSRRVCRERRLAIDPVSWSAAERVALEASEVASSESSPLVSESESVPDESESPPKKARSRAMPIGPTLLELELSELVSSESDSSSDFCLRCRFESMARRSCRRKRRRSARRALTNASRPR